MTEPTVRETWNAKQKLEKELEKLLREFENTYSINIDRINVERYTYRPLVEPTSTLVSIVLDVSIKSG